MTADIIRNFRGNKKRRDITLLVILLGILLVILLVRILNYQSPEEGSLRVVICGSCKHQMIKQIKDIDDPEHICPECGGEIAYAWKCDACGYEYPLILPPIPTSQKKTMDKFKAVVEMQRCPNCGSTETHPLSINEVNPQ